MESIAKPTFCAIFGFICHYTEIWSAPIKQHHKDHKSYGSAARLDVPEGDLIPIRFVPLHLCLFLNNYHL